MGGGKFLFWWNRRDKKFIEINGLSMDKEDKQIPKILKELTLCLNQ